MPEAILDYEEFRHEGFKVMITCYSGRYSIKAVAGRGHAIGSIGEEYPINRNAIVHRVTMEARERLIREIEKIENERTKNRRALP